MPVWNTDNEDQTDFDTGERYRREPDRPRRRVVYPPQPREAPPRHIHQGDLPREAYERRRQQAMENRGGPYHDEGYPVGPSQRRPPQMQHGRRWEDPRQDSFDIWQSRWSEQPGGWENMEGYGESENPHAARELPGFNPGQRRSPDEDIRGDIYELLSVNRYIYAPMIDVYVRGGRVRLEGVVRSPGERDMAGRMARMVAGVTEVDNRLRVGR